MENGYENWVWLAFSHYKKVASLYGSSSVPALKPLLKAKLFPHYQWL